MIADISGHGLPAGQLMGMLKTAMRLAVQFRQMPVAALESVDHVLPDLKEREMYATLALLRFDGSREAEYALAGHCRFSLSARQQGHGPALHGATPLGTHPRRFLC